MHSLGKLQQKRHVKRDEVERLCQEIEHLRVMSISAGVVPNGGGGGGGGTNKEGENPPDNPYGNIPNAEGNSKMAKGKTKEKSVERQQQQQETESQSGTKKSWVSFLFLPGGGDIHNVIESFKSSWE
jgi:hypothetical protein